MSVVKFNTIQDIKKFRNKCLLCEKKILIELVIVDVKLYTSERQHFSFSGIRSKCKFPLIELDKKYIGKFRDHIIKINEKGEMFSSTIDFTSILEFYIDVHCHCGYKLTIRNESFNKNFPMYPTHEQFSFEKNNISYEINNFYYPNSVTYIKSKNITSKFDFDIDFGYGLENIFNKINILLTFQ